MFNKGEVKPDASSKGKLLSLLRAFPKDEPTKKKFIGEMVAWSARLGEYPAGDPEIHHVAGSLFAESMCIFSSLPPSLPSSLLRFQLYFILKKAPR